MRNCYSTPAGDVLMALVFNPETLASNLSERHRRYLRRFIPPYKSENGEYILLIPLRSYFLTKPSNVSINIQNFILASELDLSLFDEIEHSEIDGIFGLELSEGEQRDNWDLI